MQFLAHLLLVIIISQRSKGWTVQESIRKLLNTLDNADDHDIVFPHILPQRNLVRTKRHIPVFDIFDESYEFVNYDSEVLVSENLRNTLEKEVNINGALNSSYENSESGGRIKRENIEEHNIPHDIETSGDEMNINNNANRDFEDVTIISLKNWVLEIKENPSLIIKEGLKAEWIATGERSLVGKNEGCVLQTGAVRGSPNSIVALTTCDASPIDSGPGDMTGLIQIDGDSYFIEPLVPTSGLNRQHPHIIYRSKSKLVLYNDENFENSQQNDQETEKSDVVRENSYEIIGEENGENFNATRSKRESYLQQNTTELRYFNESVGDNSQRISYKDMYETGDAENLEKSRAVIEHIRRKLEREEEVGYFLDALWETEVSEGNRRNEFSVNAPRRWLELALAVDHTVIKFHGKERVQQYVLALMNIVSAIYKDPSLSSNLQLVIVRMIFFEDENDNQVIEGNSKRSLENVNHWNEKLNGQHDVAVWLTRADLGGPSGYAPVSGACDPTRSCTLNRDEGLTSAFIIAHEVAHVLGLTHDGDLAAGNDCIQEAVTGSVMAPMVSATFHRFSWSSCSRREFHIKAAQWTCLRNQPRAGNATQLNSTLGATYSMDEQCRMEFGDGYSLCRTLNLPDPCSHLWCGHYSAPLVCKTKKGPPLEGTECGVNHWCVDGYCELVDRRRFRFDPVTHNRRDGGWSEWSDWTSCSRSCGYGVTFRTRACDNPRPDYGGQECSGKSEEFKICGNATCPGPLKDIRAQQCARLPTLIPLGGLGHRVNNTWLAHEADPSSQKCQLTCVSKETGEVFMSGENLLDGTPCSYDQNDKSICIQGHCQILGCDGIMDSTMKEDSCGVCGGNNLNCHNITSTFNRRLRRDMTRVAVFPYMARDIWIDVFTTPQHDYDYELVNLVIRDRRSQQYRLTSPSDRKLRTPGPVPIYGTVTVWTVPSNKKKEHHTSTTVVVEGAKFHYERKGNHERLTARGPILAELVVSMSADNMAVDRGVQVATKSGYVLHEAVLSAGSRYVWQEGGWGPCSRSCGGGRRHKTVACRDIQTGRLVPRRHCSLVAKPPIKISKCNLMSCDFVWVPAEWEECTATCGSRGVQEREVFCVHNQTDPNDPPWKYMVDPKRCQAGVQPETIQPCNRIPCPAYWMGGNWSQCSASCGYGFETREFRCPAPRGEPFFDCGPSPSDEKRLCRGIYRRHDPECYKPKQCRRDASMYCRLTKLLGRYCVIPGFRKLCCKSCSLSLNMLPE